MNLSDFITFYKENLTTRGLMKKKYKVHYYVIPIIYLLIAIIPIGVKYMFGLDNFYSYIIFAIIILFDVLLFIFSTRKLIFNTMKKMDEKFVVEKIDKFAVIF